VPSAAQVMHKLFHSGTGLLLVVLKQLFRCIYLNQNTILVSSTVAGP